MAPRARFELATLRLTAECSTIELPGNGQVGTKRYLKSVATARASVNETAAFAKAFSAQNPRGSGAKGRLEVEHQPQAGCKVILRLVVELSVDVVGFSAHR